MSQADRAVDTAAQPREGDALSQCPHAANKCSPSTATGCTLASASTVADTAASADDGRQCPHAASKRPSPLATGCSMATVSAQNAMKNSDNCTATSESLSEDRVTSSIPKNGGNSNWQYPSPSMFYNSMKRKGWRPQEGDMDVVVAIHNTVNESTWEKIIAWESLHPGPPPVLVKFEGRPNTLSPKARFRTLLGWEKPFDRHDWLVGRGDKEVRYVIDYYAHEPGNGQPPTTLIDARPAIDSPGAFFDRFVMRYYVLRQRYWPISPPITMQSDPTSATTKQADNVS